MSPPGDVTQTPESKSTGGLVSVFKSLTGNKSVKSPSLRTQASIAQQLNNAQTSKNTIHDSPSHYDALCNQLKAENPLAERLVAVEALKGAILEYPLSGVGPLRWCQDLC